MTDKTRELKVRRAQAADPILIASLSQLPPEMLETVWLGALLTVRLADDETAAPAHRILTALEYIRASTLDGEVVLVRPTAPTTSPERKAVAHHLDTHALKHALVYELKLLIGYLDGKNRATKRTVWPLAVEDFGPQGAMLAWCEKRKDFRNFRFDRITELAIIQQRFEATRNVMLAFFESLQAAPGEGEQ